MEKEANVDTVQLIDKKTNMNQPFRINVDLRVPANNQFKKQLYDGLQNKVNKNHHVRLNIWTIN